MREILLDPASLTVKLKKAGKFEVRVVAEQFMLPEQKILSRLALLQKQVVWCREALLCVNDAPWILAKTYIPLKSLQGKGRRFLFLGTQALGAILFQDPHLQRSAFEVDWQEKNPARSSVFHFYGLPLLVEEIFLPKAQQYFNHLSPCGTNWQESQFGQREALLARSRMLRVTGRAKRG